MTDYDPGLGAGKGAFPRVLASVGVILLLSALGSWGVLPRNHFMTPAAVNKCRECGGDGRVEAMCIKCFGRDYYHGQNCTECNHTGKVEQTCRFCGGSGKKPE